VKSRRTGSGTAKANGIEPHAWLIDILTKLPTTQNRDIDNLLPIR